MPIKVSILSAGETEAALVHALLGNSLNVDRVDQSADVLSISPELAAQIRRVQVDGTWTKPTKAGGGEFFEVSLKRQTVYRSTTVASADLKLHRSELKSLLGDINVLVLHPKYYQAIARFLPLSRAHYLQTELGLDASAAIMEALNQTYGVTIERLTVERPKLAERIGKLGNAKWLVDITKTTPAERFPIAGLAVREARVLYRELDDLITSECRKVAPEQRLLSETLNESSAPLIIVFAGDEDFAFTPALSVDWLKVAQAVVAPRPGVTYVAEPLIDLRLTNDGDATATLEGFNPAAGAAIWNAIVKSTVRPTSSWTLSRGSALVAGLTLASCLAVFALFGGATAALAAFGTLSAILAEVALVFVALSKPAIKPGAPVAPPRIQTTAPAEAGTPDHAPDEESETDRPETVPVRKQSKVTEHKQNGFVHAK
jgi:hypothetical protein